jgi:D-arabinose 1-dehydrogenase-like Zn-dependent alcohol dehydrogenase
MKGLMKAARLYKPKEPLKIEEVPIPEIGSEEVLVEMKACGICATDVHTAIHGMVPISFNPIILGHEPSGVIAEVGSSVKGWKAGDRVISLGATTCGICPLCRDGRDSLCLFAKVMGMHRDGAFAEYFKISARSLVTLPESITFDQGAILTDAVATPFHALTKRGNLLPGETVAVFGCGGLGIHAVQLARLCGASKIIAVDVSDAVLSRAKKIGADETIHAGHEKPARRVKEMTGGSGVDLSLEFVGLNETIDQAVKSLKRGGRTVVSGIGMKNIEIVPPAIFVWSENQLIGSFGSDLADIERLIGFVSENRLDISESISAKIPLEELNQGIHDLENKVGNPVRIVVSRS